MAVSKQTQVNTFNDGMQKDLNPLLTPNTVMSDCLNGTILTYNGNEFALQNDLGNYKMKYGSLDPGFVPIGIKEHANVLYIISYNPISDEVEIGSFPSMKTVNESSINRNGNGVENDITLNKDVNLYTELTGKCSLTLLSELNDDFKLNPGDGYILDLPDDNNDDYLWKYLATYVFTDNSKLYNIDDYIQLSNISDSATVLQSEFKNVTWDVPGWLAIKPSVNVMEEFSAYVDEVEQKYVDNNPLKNVWIDLHTTWEGKRFSTEVKNNSEYDYIIDAIHKNLFYKYKTSPTEIENSWSEEGWNNYYTGNITKQYSDINFTIHNTLYLEEVQDSYIAIVPCLKVGDKTIVYDQFLTTFKLEEKPFDPSILVVADQLFKYSWDENHPDYMKFRFDCLNAENSELHYNFISYATGERVGSGSWKQIDGLEPSSVTLSLNIPFGDGFDKEDLYDLEMLFTPEGYNITKYPENDDKCAYFRFKVYASEIMNYWSDKCDNFTDLDDSDFIEAMSVLKISSLNNNDSEMIESIKSSINNFYKSNIEDKVDVGEEFEDILNKINFSTDYSGNTVVISKGIRYYLNKDVIDFPKDQDDNIGKFWKSLSIKSISGEAHTYNGDTLDIGWSTRPYIDATSKYKVDIYSDSLQVPLSDVKPICLKDNTISFDGDWCILRKMYVLTKKDKNKRQGYKYGSINISSELDFRFMVNKNYKNYKNNSDWIIKIKTKSLKTNREVEFNVTYNNNGEFECNDIERLLKFISHCNTYTDEYYTSGVGWKYNTLKSEKDGSNETGANDEETTHCSQDFSDFLNGINYVIYSGSRDIGKDVHATLFLDEYDTNKGWAGWGTGTRGGYQMIHEVDHDKNDARYLAFMCISGGEENFTFSIVNINTKNNDVTKGFAESFLRYLLVAYSCRASMGGEPSTYYYNKFNTETIINKNIEINGFDLKVDFSYNSIPNYLKPIFADVEFIEISSEQEMELKNNIDLPDYSKILSNTETYLSDVFEGYNELPTTGKFVFKVPEILLDREIKLSLDNILNLTEINEDKITVYGQKDKSNRIRLRSSNDNFNTVAYVVKYE